VRARIPPISITWLTTRMRIGSRHLHTAPTATRTAVSRAEAAPGRFGGRDVVLQTPRQVRVTRARAGHGPALRRSRAAAASGANGHLPVCPVSGCDHETYGAAQGLPMPNASQDL